ncbi:aminoglycoside phosphotransferase family protein [Patescibacteria group bacterium]|nr:aminoglycoside phosphotransferase family protein [Patescibacteria group bacterium]MBU1868361.1 aminoglycoside phosphotransferase family protein [Patescibacteria group bacterium]
MQVDSLKIKHILEERELKLLWSEVRGEIISRSYLAGVECKSGEKLLLKVLLQAAEVDKKDFLKEITFLRRVTINNQSGIGRFVPKLVDSQTEQFPFWSLREFVSGSSAGSVVSDFGWNEIFLESGFHTELLTFLQELQSLRVEKFFPELGWLKTGDVGEYFINRLRFVHGDVIGFIGDDRFRKIISEFNRLKSCLGGPKLVLCHSDLYPDNVLLTDDSKVKIIDWDHLGVNNPALDLAFFWAMAWKKPSWQSTLLEGALEMLPYHKGDFLCVFWLMQVHFSINLVAHGLRMLNAHKREKRTDAVRTAQLFLDTQLRGIEKALQELGAY